MCTEGRLVLCGVFGRGTQSLNGGGATLKYRASDVERMLVERGVNIADGEKEQLLVGIGVFKSYVFLDRRNTKWHTPECLAMYRALATKSKNRTFQGAILVPVVVAAPLAHPIPYITGQEGGWWTLADWRETKMMDGVTAQALMERWSTEYKVRLEPKGAIVQWMPLAKALVQSQWPLFMYAVNRHTLCPPQH